MTADDRLPAAMIDMAMAPDGNAVVTGYVGSENGDIDILTFKQDHSGATLWEAQYDGAEQLIDVPGAVDVDGQGNVYVSGTTQRDGRFDLVVLKYSPTGNLLWTFYKEGSEEPLIAGIDVVARDDGSGAFVLASQWDTGLPRWRVIRLSSDGQEMYASTSPGINPRVGVAISVHQGSGRAVVTGIEIDLATELVGWITVNYHADGQEEWTVSGEKAPVIQHWTGHIFYNHPRALAVRPSGHVVVVGTEQGADDGWWGTTGLYGPTGTEEWIHRDSQTFAQADVAMNDGGGVVLAGTSRGSEYEIGIVTTKLEADGTLAWRQQFEANADDPFSYPALSVDDAGNVFVVGQNRIHDGVGDAQDAIVLKYDAAGTLLQSAPHENPVHPSIEMVLEHVGVGTGGQVFVGGYYWGFLTSPTVSTAAYSSTLNVLWTEHREGAPSPRMHAQAARVDTQGNHYVAGLSFGEALFHGPTGFRRQNLVVAKHAPDGELLWLTHVVPDEEPRLLWARTLELSPDGAVYVAGEASYANTTFHDTRLFVGRLGAGGELEWLRFEGIHQHASYAKDLAVDGDGNVYATGVYGEGFGVGSDGSIVVKYAPNGERLWIVTDAAELNSTGSRVLFDSQGNPVVIGGGRSPNGDIVVRKFTPEGEQIWMQRHAVTQAGHSPSNIVAHVDAADHIHISSAAFSSMFDLEVVTMRLSAGGSLVWSKRYAVPDANVNPLTLHRDFESGHLSLVARVQSFVTGWSYTLLRYDEAGQVDLQVPFPGLATDAHIAEDGAFFVMEVAPDNGFLHKFEREGQPEWTAAIAPENQRYGHFPVILTINPDVESIFTVSETGIRNLEDLSSFWTVGRYLGKPVDTEAAPGPSDLLRVFTGYPNPANETIRIPFAVGHSGNVVGHVYNVLGQRVATVEHGMAGAGAHQLTWNTRALPSGTYVMRLTLSSDDGVVTSQNVMFTVAR